jgi:phosphoenolpyruvate-protein phosphotransferase (PTS system enzyme I)
MPKSPDEVPPQHLPGQAQQGPILPEGFQRGLSIFGLPKSQEEEVLMRRGLRALDFSRDTGALHKIVSDPANVGKVDDGRLLQHMEEVTGHKFTTPLRFFRDLRRSIIEGSEQRWKQWRLDQPFKDELSGFEDRARTVGVVTEESLPCEVGVIRTVGVGRLYRLESMAIDKRTLVGESVTQEQARAVEFARHASTMEVDYADPFASINQMLLVDLVMGNGTPEQPKDQPVDKEDGTRVIFPSALSLVTREGITTEHAIMWAAEERAKLFRGMKNKQFQSMANDVIGAAKFGITLLTGSDPDRVTDGILATMPPNTVLAVEEIDAATAGKYARNPNILAVIPEDATAIRGHIGKTFANEGKLVASVPGGFMKRADVRTGDTIVIDPTGQPRLIITPNVDTADMMAVKRDEIRRQDDIARLNAPLDCVTKDGFKVRLAGNTENVSGCGRIGIWGGDGVQLVRTENMFAQNERLPSEEEQVQEYRAARHEFEARAQPGKRAYPVRFRFFDVGRDKTDYKWLQKLEADTGKKLHGIEFLLGHRDVLKTQARAFLQAGAEEAMVPMIQTAQQFDEVSAVVEEAKAELRREGKQFNENMKLGMMVETTGAYMGIGTFDKPAFRSIGSNDLSHTLLDKEERQDLPESDPYTPIVFHAMYEIILSGYRQNVKTSVCGDMAGTKRGAKSLVGMYALAMEEASVDEDKCVVSPELSMLSNSIPEVKDSLMSTNASDMRIIVKRALARSDPKDPNAPLKSWKQVRDYLDDQMRAKGIEF